MCVVLAFSSAQSCAFFACRCRVGALLVPVDTCDLRGAEKLHVPGDLVLTPFFVVFICAGVSAVVIFCTRVRVAHPLINCRVRVRGSTWKTRAL